MYNPVQITHNTCKQEMEDDIINRKRVLPPTSQRVFLRTDPLVNAEIRNQTIRNLSIYKNCSEADLTERIRNLNLEWDTERVMELNAATLIILSTIMGIKYHKCWFLLTGMVGVFLLQHALQGWCPPLPIIRRWGTRTADEIHTEQVVLKVMRGDFTEGDSSVVELLNMVEKQ